MFSLFCSNKLKGMFVIVLFIYCLIFIYVCNDKSVSKYPETFTVNYPLELCQPWNTKTIYLSSNLEEYGVE